MIDGLLVAMGVIIERVKKLKFTKRIFLVTTLFDTVCCSMRTYAVCVCVCVCVCV